jgi:hypothetical protein
MPLMSLPSGPGLAADASAPLAEATAVCRTISTFSAELGVRGTIAGARARARLLTGLAGDDAFRIEALAPFGQPLFIVASRLGRATVVLSDDRVLEAGAPGPVLEALTGVPIGATELRPLLTGCARTPTAGRARALGRAWLIVPDGEGDLFLNRTSDGDPWRLVAAVYHQAAGREWRVEYRDFLDGLPGTLRLVGAGDDRFDLRLTLSQVSVNEPLGPEVFEVRMPAGATPISLEELRRSAPWSR